MRNNRRRPGRREVLQQLAASAGGMFVFPLVVSTHPIHSYLRDTARVGSADARANAAAFAPEVLTREQFALLRSLAERIVPGSTAAKSSEFIDQLLAVATAADRRRFVEALSAFDELAIGRTRRPWNALSERDQIDLLTFASTEKPGTATSDSSGASALTRVTVRDHFDHLKGWIAGAYYSSERGMRELGWTGNMFFTAFPGCEGHGDH